LSRETSEVEVWRGLSARAFILALVLEIPLLFLSFVLSAFTNKPDTYGCMVFSLLYVVLASVALGKASGRLRLNAGELMAIYVAMGMMASHSFIPKNSGGHSNALRTFDWTVLMEGSVFGEADWLWRREGVGDWDRMTPSWLFPTGDQRFVLGDIILHGLKPGQTFDMGALTIPMLYWIAVLLLYDFIGLFIVFLVGKPWVEEERLVFPMAVPMMYLFKNADEIDPTTNQPRIINLKDPKIKVFWGGIVIGLILSLAPFIVEVYPPAAVTLPTAWWGEQTLRFPGEALASAFPGAYSTGVLTYDQALMWLLVPNDILYTSIFVYIVFGVIWQGYAVAAKIIPYEPGIEFLNPWDAVPGHMEPFPYANIGSYGMGLGIAVWLVWTLRHRIKQVFSTLRGDDIVEHGLSLRSMAWFGIAVMAGWLVLETAVGAPFITNLGFLVVQILYALLIARIWAVFWWHTQAFTDNSTAIEIPYYVGSKLGYWGPMENFGDWNNPNTSYPWYIYQRTTWALGTWTIMFTSATAGGKVNFYKIAHYNKLNLKHLFVLMILCSVVYVVLGQVISVWLTAHGGGITNSNLWGWTLWGPSGSYWSDSSWGPTSFSFQNDMIYMSGGALVAIALYLIRLRFAWFFISPEALYVNTFLPNYNWMNALIALIVKTVGIRTVGIRKFEEYVMPAATGAVIGFGALWIVAGLINFGTIAWPKLMVQYVP